MSRWKASGIHLAISLTLALCVSALLYLLWFPPPYFIAAGATGLMLLIVGVDIVVGPALTLLVFNPAKSKRQLRLDLSIIAIVQTIAFAYGLFVICQTRPVFVVAVVDRLRIVMANELSDADLAKGHTPEFRHRSWTGPLLVGAKPGGADTLKLALQALESGKDIDIRPQYYVSYSDAAESLMRHSRSLSQLKGLTPVQKGYLQGLSDRAAKQGDTLRYIPLQSRKTDFAAILSTRTNRLVAVLATDPW